jgi:HNH endonuclease
LRRINSLPNYLADSDGHIWREKDDAITPLPERKLNNGYLAVTVMVNGKPGIRHVHVLVAEAFHGPRPTGQVVRHLTGDKTINTPQQLAYGTRKDNAADDRRHGKVRRGENHPRAKLTAADAHAVREALKMNVERKVIAANFGVSVYCITDIALGRRWRVEPATDKPADRDDEPASLVA